MADVCCEGAGCLVSGQHDPKRLIGCLSHGSSWDSRRKKNEKSKIALLEFGGREQKKRFCVV